MNEVPALGPSVPADQFHRILDEMVLYAADDDACDLEVVRQSVLAQLLRFIVVAGHA